MKEILLIIFTQQELDLIILQNSIAFKILSIFIVLFFILFFTGYILFIIKMKNQGKNNI